MEIVQGARRMDSTTLPDKTCKQDIVSNHSHSLETRAVLS